jgi:hypothetical protein
VKRRPRWRYDDVARTHIESRALYIRLFGIGEERDSAPLAALRESEHARELLIPALDPEPIEIGLRQRDTKSSFGRNQDVALAVPHGLSIGDGIGQLESDASRHPNQHRVTLLKFSRCVRRDMITRILASSLGKGRVSERRPKMSAPSPKRQHLPEKVGVLD